MIKRIHEIGDTIKEQLNDLSDFIHEHPELGYEEEQASKAHMDLLQAHGFKVEHPYIGLDTAFKASYQNPVGGDPVTIAYLVEYDALPGLGHACGHNLIGTASTGAAIILSKLVNDLDLPVKILVFGTPAEETSGSKVEFVEKGCFDGVDVALMSHPGDDYYKSGRSLALRALEFEFFGRTSHAASNPEAGLNALDAVINMFNSVNALRQQLIPSARVHGIITNGGQAANIIPDYTAAQFYVRAEDIKDLEDIVDKVIQCAESGAAAAGCTMKYHDFEAAYKNLVTNETLSKVHTGALEALGLKHVDNERVSFGSLDAGDVSHVVPTIHPYHRIAPKGTAAHTTAFEALAGSQEAFESNMITTKALAYSGYQVATDQVLLKAIQEEFKLHFKS